VTAGTLFQKAKLLFSERWHVVVRKIIEAQKQIYYSTGDNLSSADGHIIGGENWTRHDMSGCKD
jgi:hypothetical protein